MGTNTYMEKLTDQFSELYVSLSGEPYADIKINGHIETWPIDSQEFRTFLYRWHFQETQSVLKQKRCRELLDYLLGLATLCGKEKKLWVRTAKRGDEIYLDIGNDSWEAIRVTADDWRVVESIPDEVRFRRALGVRPIPTPVRGGSLEELRELLNLDGDDQWYLLASWLVASLRPAGPYPILVVNGGPGSGKSSASDILRALIDPNAVPLRGQPHSEREAFVAAGNAWLYAVDNISFLSDKMSDVFCRLSTGGGFVTRKLYTDSREALFDVCCPALFNGIQEFCSRSDFADRAIQITLKRIPDEKRKPAAEVRRVFEEKKAVIFGGLLDVLVKVQRELPSIVLKELPRMADFALVATAVERAMGWEEGVVMKAYDQMRENSNQSVLEANPFVATLDRVLDQYNGKWVGTATELYDQIRIRLDEDDWRHFVMPKDPARLSGQLRRIASALRSVGIEVDCDGKTAGSGSKRVISVQRINVPVKSGEEPKRHGPIHAIREGIRESHERNVTLVQAAAESAKAKAALVSGG